MSVIGVISVISVSQHVTARNKLMHLIIKFIRLNLGEKAVSLIESNAQMLSIVDYKKIYRAAMQKRCVIEVVLYIYLRLKPHIRQSSSMWGIYEPLNVLIAASEKGYTDLFKYVLVHAEAASSTLYHNWPHIYGYDIRYILDITFIRACENNNIDLVKFIAAHPLHSMLYSGYHAFYQACLFGTIEIVRFLLNYPGIDACLAGGLIKACNNGKTPIVKLLLEDGRVAYDADNNEAFRRAVLNGYIEIVKLLIQVDAEYKITRNLIEQMIEMSYNIRERIGTKFTDTGRYLKQVQEDRYVKN